MLISGILEWVNFDFAAELFFKSNKKYFKVHSINIFNSDSGSG